MYKFSYNTYFQDDTGYSAVTHPYCSIAVFANNRDEAKSKVFKALEGAEYKHNWSLRAELKEVDEVLTLEEKEQ